MINRRKFLSLATALFGINMVFPTFAENGSKDAGSKLTREDIIDPADDPWLTLTVVQDHLFPSDGDGPGANEINATTYLQSVLSGEEIDPDEKDFILKGVRWLNDISRKHENNDFALLDAVQREFVLRRIEKTGTGERWLSMILSYIFEALLSDPIYGGNPDGIGWRWLQHKPGYPRPNANQKYTKL